MKKFLINSALFLGVVLLFARTTGAFDNADVSYNTNGDVIKSNRMQEFDSLDVLFVGNSYCYSAINTPLLNSEGKRTFNLGLPTAGVQFYTLLLNHYLQQVKQKPDTIMLMVSPMTFSLHADNWTDYPVHRYLSAPVSNEQLTLQFGGYSHYLPLLFNSCRKGITNITERKRKTSLADYSYLYERFGFYIDSTVTNDKIERETKHLYTPLLEDHFNTKQTEQMLTLANQLKASGITVLFFEPPVHHLTQYFTPAFMQDYEKCMASLQQSFTVNRAPKAPANLFRNIDHMNTQGATWYTQHLFHTQP